MKRFHALLLFFVLTGLNCCGSQMLYQRSQDPCLLNRAYDAIQANSMAELQALLLNNRLLANAQDLLVHAIRQRRTKIVRLLLSAGCIPNGSERITNADLELSQEDYLLGATAHKLLAHRSEPILICYFRSTNNETARSHSQCQALQNSLKRICNDRLFALHCLFGMHDISTSLGCKILEYTGHSKSYIENFNHFCPLFWIALVGNAEEIQHVTKCMPPEYHQRAWLQAAEYANGTPYKEDHSLIAYGHYAFPERANILHKAKININAQSAAYCGKTALLLTVSFAGMGLHKYGPMAILLLRAGADANVSDYDGTTALHKATNRGNLNLIKNLLQFGADANQPDDVGATALTTAAAEGMEDIVELFLENGAIVSHLDIDSAYMYGHDKLAQRLEIWRETHKPNLVSYVRSKLKIHRLAAETQTREQAVEAAVQACVEKIVQTIEGHHRLKAVIPEIARSCRYPDNRLAAGLEEWSVKQEPDLLTHITERLGLDIAPTKRKLLAQQKVTPMRASLDTLIETVQKNDPLLQREIPMVLTWQAQCQRASRRI